jgi:hypothetical protein
VKIKNKGLNLASLLDAAGYAKSTVNIVDEGDFVKIELPANAMYVVLEKSTGIGENSQKEKGMKIFPNPSNGTFSVEINNFKPEEYTFELIGLQGDKVSQINEIREPAFLVDTGKLSPGVFFAVLKNKSGKIETEKIIIQNK